MTAAVVSAPRGARQTGFNGSLTGPERKALAALKEALLAFALDHHGAGEQPSDGEEGEALPPNPRADDADDAAADVAAEAELLAQSRAGLLRFLRSRDFNVIKARDLAVAACTWRAAATPWALDLDAMPAALPSGAWRFGGHSKAGMPILQFDCAAWAPWEYPGGVGEYARYVAYIMEGALGRMGPGVEQVCMIWSVMGWTQKLMQPLAVRCMEQLIHILQTVYPERTGVIFLCNTNQLFQGYFYRILRPWMGYNLLSKFCFLSRPSALLESVDASQLPGSIGLTEIPGTHEEFPIPFRSVSDELDVFIAELGGPDRLPAANVRTAAAAAAPQTRFAGGASGTHTGQVDLLQGKPCSLEVDISESTLGIDWHISGDLLGVVFGYKVCRAGGAEVVEEGTTTQDAGCATPSKSGAIGGNLAVQKAWAGCTLKLALYSSYSREDCRTLAYCIGIEAR